MPKSKYLRQVITGLVVIAVVLAALLTYQPKEASGPKCGLYGDDKTVTIGTEKIKAEVVQTPAEREKGLGGRPCIESNQAMLFIFDKPGRYAIWMKDMRFPIDIVWINYDHKVVGLEIDVLPSTYPDRFVNKDNPALYVLELQANRAKELNVGLGTPINF